MKYDHVAIKTADIPRAISWYVDNWDADVLYIDDTWAVIELGNTKLSFVLTSKHPAHIGFEVDDMFIQKKLSDKTFKPHRDGSSSCYVRDPDGNFIEFLRWPTKVK